MCNGHMHRGSHVEVPNSNSISCSHSSLLECSLPPRRPAPGIDSQPGHVCPGCFSRGWRWPWSSLFRMVTLTWFKTTRTCKYLIIQGKVYTYSIHLFLFFEIFFLFTFCIQHCFICRPSNSTVLTDAGIEPRTIATVALAVRRSNH